MSERIFLGQAEGPAKVTVDGITESRDTKARKHIIELLRTDPKMQERFNASGKSEEDFIAEYVKYSGDNAVTNYTRLGMDTILAERNRQSRKSF